MSDLKKLYIFLSQFDLTSKKINSIINYLGDNASITGLKETRLDEAKLLTGVVYQKMLSVAEDSFVDTYVINLNERGIKIVCKDDKEYPEQFKFDEAPCILYYKGDISLLRQPALSVVGTRKPTNYGKMITERIVKDVAAAGVVIVSGLAYGVDSIAHRAALEVGGKTIAVLGGGFDHIYPSEHEGLANEIAQKGLLISEYRPKKLATKYTFIERNRIVAGISKAVLITEASLKSGTIHTSDFALSYGHDVYAIPGNIDSPNSALTNDMIKNGHAKLVTSSKDILDDYDINLIPKKTLDLSKFSEDEQKILSQLFDGMKTVEEVTKKSTLSINIFNSCLTTLEISGIIRRMPGGYLALN